MSDSTQTDKTPKHAAAAPGTAAKPGPGQTRAAPSGAAQGDTGTGDAGKAGAARTDPAKSAPAKPAPAAEIGGPAGPEPTRYGDWEIKGRCIDF